MSITQRLSKKTIYGWALTKMEGEIVSNKQLLGCACIFLTEYLQHKYKMVKCSGINNGISGSHHIKCVGIYDLREEQIKKA